MVNTYTCFFSIDMEPCKSEVDITIVDRICALLNPQPICVCNPISNDRNLVSFQSSLLTTINESSLLFHCVNFRINKHCFIKLWKAPLCQILQLL